MRDRDAITQDLTLMHAIMDAERNMGRAPDAADWMACDGLLDELLERRTWQAPKPGPRKADAGHGW